MIPIHFDPISHIAPPVVAPAPAPTRQEMVAAAQTVQRLEKVANRRKCGVKVGAVCCTPIALIGFCFASVMNGCSCKNSPYTSIDPNGVAYSPFTRCDGGSYWRPKLWPEGCSDLWCDSVCCDPCICCVCCTHETPNDFLYYPERQQMNGALRILALPVPEAEEGEVDFPGVEILQNLAVPAPSPDRQPVFRLG